MVRITIERVCLIFILRGEGTPKKSYPIYNLFIVALLQIKLNLISREAAVVRRYARANVVGSILNGACLSWPRVRINNNNVYFISVRYPFSNNYASSESVN